MARQTTVIYSCDSCGQNVDGQRDLQRFALQLVTWGGRQNVTTSVDLCEECEPRFLAAVEPFFPGEKVSHLHAMSREED